MPNDATFFRDLTYVLLAAAGGGALAWLARQPLILGYILGGILVSPFTPGPVVSELHTFELFAEIGIILLMFFIGAEFSPRELLALKWVGLVGGCLGIAGLMGLGYGAARLLGLSGVAALIVGMIVSTASTLVLVRLLLDRGELHARYGRVAVGITLVDDLAVVVFIFLIPSLGSLERERLAALGWSLARAGAVLIPFGLLAARGFPRLLARVARSRNPELFLLVTLLLGVGTAALSYAAGLSLALGAFLAGLFLSGSDYVHEALARLLPLRDVFVAVFFVTVGVLIDPRTLLDNVPLVGAMVGVVLVGKLLVWTLTVRLFREGWKTALLVAGSLTQIGEFAFLLARAGRSAGHIGAEVFNATLVTALVTIVVNAALIRLLPAWLARWEARGRPGTSGEEEGARAAQGGAVLCGYGPVGSAVGEALAAFGIPFSVVEGDPDVVAGLRSRGMGVLFGDARQERILEAAGVGEARLLVVTLPEAAAAVEIVRTARRMRPELSILARAGSPEEQVRLRAAGASGVVQPRLEGAAWLIGESLGLLGEGAGRVEAYLARFREATGLPAGRGAAGAEGLPEVREVRLGPGGVADLSLREAGVRERFGILVLAVLRGDGELLVSPGAETVLRAGDRVRLFGRPEQIERFRAEGGEPASASWSGGA